MVEPRFHPPSWLPLVLAVVVLGAGTVACTPAPGATSDVVLGASSGGTATAPATTTTAPTTTTTSRIVSPTQAGGLSSAATTSATTRPKPGTALAAVATLTVKGRAAKTGYSRAAFGQTWFDADRNGCDTRNDVLRRDLAARQMKNSCKVLAGTLSPDPYTGTFIRFVYGGASEVDVDHVVALSDAWQKGAARWAAGKRLAFANDPLNLLAVDAHTNRSKGDGDTATWLPPNHAYRCTYVARQVAVKRKYAVWVTAAESAAMTRVLSGCPTLRLPGPGAAPTVAATPRTTTAAPTTTSTPRTTTSTSSIRAGVHPGAYCSPAGALGRTVAGTLMRCSSTATDSRNRWRRA
jgi:hypothetical protein